MICWCECSNVAFLIVGGESGDTPYFMKRVVVKQQINPFTAIQIAPSTLTNYAGVFRAYRKSFERKVLERLNLIKQRIPTLFSLFVRCRIPWFLCRGRIDQSNHLSRWDRIALFHLQ